MDIENKWMEMYDSSVNFILLKLWFTVVVQGIILRRKRKKEGLWNVKDYLKSGNTSKLFLSIERKIERRTIEGLFSTWKACWNRGKI